MALILFGHSRCAICRALLTEGEAIVATSHFIADHHHPLWRFSDAALHRACFLTWEQRAAFVALFNQVAADIVSGNGTVQQMDSTGTITVRPARPANELRQ